MKENIWNDENLIKVLKKGGIAVMPTDTIYGIVGVRKRIHGESHLHYPQKKSRQAVHNFDWDTNELEVSVFPTEEQKIKLEELWHISAMADMCQERAISIILDCPDEN